MKRVVIFSGLLLMLGLTGAVAQEYTGIYQGTLTLTVVEFPDDQSNYNLEIDNQRLELFEDGIFLPDIPFSKEGPTANIGFPNITIANNGDITGDDVEGETNSMAMVLSIVSGNVSGGQISLEFQMVDKETGGTVIDVTANYAGTKTVVGIDDISTAVEKTPVAYYSFTGLQLDREPRHGIYIVVYNTGETEKIMKP